MFKWQQGRQDGNYFKLPLVMSKFPIPWDIHLIKMTEGTYIAEHVDIFDGNKKMYRLNIILKEPEYGGEFQCEKTILDWRRIKIFRPDENKHSVSEVGKGERLVLSFGFCW